MGTSPKICFRLLRYAPEKMFNVVADVANYKTFLPWCTNSTYGNTFNVMGDLKSSKLKGLTVG